ncbi:MAG: pilus assembly protein [Chloroflexi bacterium]|nr:pilus assembly protein [Chloroflexota bacterium]
MGCPLPADRRPRTADCRLPTADSPGQGLVEFALVLPVLLLVVFGIAQWAIIMNALATVNHAAQMGARTGAAIGANLDRTNSGDADTDVRNAAKAERGVLNLADGDIMIEPAVGLRAAGSIMTVTVTYGQSIFLPAVSDLVGGVYTVTGRSAVRVE